MQCTLGDIGIVRNQPFPFEPASIVFQVPLVYPILVRSADRVASNKAEAFREKEPVEVCMVVKDEEIGIAYKMAGERIRFPAPTILVHLDVPILVDAEPPDAALVPPHTDPGGDVARHYHETDAVRGPGAVERTVLAGVVPLSHTTVTALDRVGEKDAGIIDPGAFGEPIRCAVILQDHSPIDTHFDSVAEDRDGQVFQPCVFGHLPIPYLVPVLSRQREPVDGPIVFQSGRHRIHISPPG